MNVKWNQDPSEPGVLPDLPPRVDEAVEEELPDLPPRVGEEPPKQDELPGTPPR